MIAWQLINQKVFVMFKFRKLVNSLLALGAIALAGCAGISTLFPTPAPPASSTGNPPATSVRRTWSSLADSAVTTKRAEPKSAASASSAAEAKKADEEEEEREAAEEVEDLEAMRMKNGAGGEMKV